MPKKLPVKRLAKKKHKVKHLAKKKLAAKRRTRSRLLIKQRASKRPARVLKRRAVKRLAAKKKPAAKVRVSRTKASRADDGYTSMSFAEMREMSIRTNKTLDRVGKDLDKLKVSMVAGEAKIDKTSANLDKTSANLDKTNASLDKTGKDLDKQRENIDRLGRDIDKLRETVGSHDNKWGQLTEALVIGDAQRTFNARGFKLHTTSPRVKITCPDGVTVREIDGILYGEKEVVVIEAKTKLTVQDVRNFINNILLCFTELQREHRGKGIYGTVGYLNASHQALTFAHKNGLFVIHSRHDIKEIVTTPKGFKPRNFHP